jgi:peptidyl-prolyl cis-trans isomerase B (cyclophilin B)
MRQTAAGTAQAYWARRARGPCVAIDEGTLKKARTVLTRLPRRFILAALLRLAPIVCLATPALASLALGACGTAGGGTAATRTATPVQRAPGRQARSQSFASAGGHPSACRPTKAPVAKDGARLAPPHTKLNAAKRYVVTLATNCGPIAIELDVHDSPRTTASFAYLVKRGFYDRLTFHRIASGFVVQGGDPDGDGSGGPGYTVVEPPPANVSYTTGTVAMAKGETDPAGASGSQFFIVTAPDAALPPQYALLGHVVAGMAAVKAIARIPTDPPQDGTPRMPVVIGRATLAAAHR